MSIKVPKVHLCTEPRWEFQVDGGMVVETLCDTYQSAEKVVTEKDYQEWSVTKGYIQAIFLRRLHRGPFAGPGRESAAGRLTFRRGRLLHLCERSTSTASRPP